MATTISYSLSPVPRWYFADFSGRPLGGGFMQAWSSLDPTVPKTVFQDIEGNLAWPTQTIIIGGIPYPNAILFGANGEQGPFYWEFDSSDSDDLYFLQFYDSKGNFQFPIDNFGAPGGGSGGGTFTTNNFLKNYIVNNVFWRNIGTKSNIQSGTIICPSNHAGFQFNDIQFIRSNNTATDAISFNKFNNGNVPFGSGTVPQGFDITPEFYMDCVCSSAGSETFKLIRFPVDLHVKNLEQITMTAIIWVQGVSGNRNFSVQLRQSFGTGSISPDVIVNAIPNTLASNSWAPYVGTFTIPSISMASLGKGGDDGTYLEIVLSSGGGSTSEMLFAKPKLYLGQIGQVFPELESYDEIDSLINSARTGDWRTSLNSWLPGWVAANDGSIGSFSSGANSRANQDTWPLYNLLWTNVLNHWAPVSGGRGISAIADFSANKTLTLTGNLGRVIAGLNSLTITPQTFTTNYGSSHFNLTVASSDLFITATPVQLTNSGGSLPSNLFSNTIYFIIRIDAVTIQLCSAIENLTPIDIGSDQTGISIVQTALGLSNGESLHSLTLNENAQHHHTIASGGTSFATEGGGGIFGPGGKGGSQPTTDNSGLGQGHNNIPPTTYMNVFFKL